jgi:hypothetical protein
LCWGVRIAASLRDPSRGSSIHTDRVFLGDVVPPSCLLIGLCEHAQTEKDLGVERLRKLADAEPDAERQRVMIQSMHESPPKALCFMQGMCHDALAQLATRSRRRVWRRRQRITRAAQQQTRHRFLLEGSCRRQKVLLLEQRRCLATRSGKGTGKGKGKQTQAKPKPNSARGSATRPVSAPLGRFACRVLAGKISNGNKRLRGKTESNPEQEAPCHKDHHKRYKRFVYCGHCGRHPGQQEL